LKNDLHIDYTTLSNTLTVAAKTTQSPTRSSAAKAGGKRGSKPSNHQELKLEVLMVAAGITEMSELHRRTGFSRQTLYSWKKKGLSYWRADELSIKLCGLHPSSVFGPVWWVLYSAQMAVAA